MQVWLACSPMPEEFSQQQLGAANQTHWVGSSVFDKSHSLKVVTLLVSVSTSLAVCRLQHVGVC